MGQAFGASEPITYTTIRETADERDKRAGKIYQVTSVINHASNFIAKTFPTRQGALPAAAVGICLFGLANFIKFWEQRDQRSNSPGCCSILCCGCGAIKCTKQFDGWGKLAMAFGSVIGGLGYVAVLALGIDFESLFNANVALGYISNMF